ncbi:hypothetical protein PPROV_000692800 [Pycnococcus provasolii]|uniref:Sulfatase N-terminal domain-containing protein n=1 Tax=Pycnococcus provasolii TaxID=41880 RepID=A0A830HTB2_9CHLO|nr:hypothetical protein PPROV_000692800 [Pycnococcus provasolii]|mmetsp:Transcript_7275/g.18828  ORF Transcript_7275/g.18828 Transcript_7275/m.18828 type:complete len:885 (+) Transcript_7275:75-2729(+)
MAAESLPSSVLSRCRGHAWHTMMIMILIVLMMFASSSMRLVNAQTSSSTSNMMVESEVEDVDIDGVSPAPFAEESGLSSGGSSEQDDDVDVCTSKYQQAGVSEFRGKIEPKFEDSVEDWPDAPVFTGNETNVLLIVLDDVGFAHLQPYGGVTNTSRMQSLADSGLIYNNFHTTALCSPSRAAILSSRNHHSVSLGSHALSAMGFPGYNGRIPYSAQEVTKTLQALGWTTYAIGKFDHVPLFQVHQQGPFTYWPTSDGFDHMYCFMAADANNFSPVMWDGHTPIEPFLNKPNYHLSEDLADKAIEQITGHVSINPDRPFFVYWAPGGMHAPHHAPPEYIEMYRGVFDDGWDAAREKIFARQKERGIIPPNTVLTDRIGEIPSWESQTPEDRRMFARQMEAFAGQLHHLDEQIGRIVDTLERTNKLDNTLIMITSDNGSSGEGGLAGSHNEMAVLNGRGLTPMSENMKHFDEWGSEATNNHFHAGWAMAGNTPFKYFKQIVHRGGQADPLIVHWPRGIKNRGNGIRQQYGHIIDIGTTIMDALNLEPFEYIDGVKQQPFEGTSLEYTFNDPNATDQHTRQYYEQFGNRAMYLMEDGVALKAVTIHGNRMPWQIAGTFPFEEDVWELYNITEDFSESRNIAAEYPDLRDKLVDEWDKDAWKYNVYPLYDNLAARVAGAYSIYAPARAESTYYTPGAIRIAEAYSPVVKNKLHNVTAVLNLTASPNGEPVSGVLVACGGLYGGWTFFLRDNTPVYEYNAYNEDRYKITGDSPLPASFVGNVTVVYTPGDFAETGPPDKTGTVQIVVTTEQDGSKVVGTGQVGRTMPSTFSLSETFDVGVDTGTPVSNSYTRLENNDLRYANVLDRVVISLALPDADYTASGIGGSQIG